ncbi:MAG: hypothetical protein ACRDPA_06065, partial [Solirubrobacteraceae bacterium]
EYFLQVHAEAERAYEPTQFDGELTIFYGDGLYEDPSLGWSELTSKELHSYAIPGVHDNNRQGMMEPYVGFVGDRLEEQLARSRERRLE